MSSEVFVSIPSDMVVELQPIAERHGRTVMDYALDLLREEIERERWRKMQPEREVLSKVTTLYVIISIIASFLPSLLFMWFVREYRQEVALMFILMSFLLLMLTAVLWPTLLEKRVFRWLYPKEAEVLWGKAQ